MADDSVPYWRLISILFSSFPLTPALAFRLHRSAYELYRTDRGVAKLDKDDGVVVSGEVRNLKKNALLGTLSGPGVRGAARHRARRGDRPVPADPVGDRAHGQPRVGLSPVQLIFQS